MCTADHVCLFITLQTENVIPKYQHFLYGYSAGARTAGDHHKKNHFQRFNYSRIIKAMLATLGDQLYVEPICLACRLTPERSSRGLG